MTTIKGQLKSYLENRNAYAGILVACIVLLISILWVMGDPVSTEQKAISAAMIVVAAFPAFLFLVERNAPIAPLMAINCLTYVFMFGMNGFYFFNSQNMLLTNLNEASWMSGQLLGIFGVISQIAGYTTARAIFGNPKPIRLLVGLEPSRIMLMSWSLLAFRASSILVPEISDIPTITVFAKITPYVGIGLLIMLSLKEQLPPIQSVILYWVAIPLEIIYRLNLGAIYEPVLMVIFIFFIRWVIGRKINWIVLTAALMIYAIFNPVKHDYRQVVWRTGSAAGSEKSSVEKLTLFFELAGEYWWSSQNSKETVRANLMSRLNHLVMAAMVTELTPGQIPYWEGETLEAASVSFIPRIFWPNKPKLTFGNQFGVRYGVISQQETSTTINMTWVVELYANFGYTGVFFGMTLIGIAFAFLERWTSTPGTALIDVILPLTTFFPLIYPESNIVMMWGGVITSMFAFYIIALALKR